jgi:hypothetical protein
MPITQTSHLFRTARLEHAFLSNRKSIWSLQVDSVCILLTGSSVLVLRTLRRLRVDLPESIVGKSFFESEWEITWTRSKPEWKVSRPTPIR